MPTVTIEGRKIEVEEGTLIIEAARRLGIDIPHFCYHPKLSIAANCRMCLVEVANVDRFGRLKRNPKPVPSCQQTVSDGMEVYLTSERIKEVQAGMLEFILTNHPVDCPICDKSGECPLQDQYFEHSSRVRRMTDPKRNKPKKEDIGRYILLDNERCVACTRCIRFLDEYTGTSELEFVQRGNGKILTVFPEARLDNPYSLNVCDICPVGALTSKEFRFRCRVWYMKDTPSVCPGCSRGCNIFVQHHLGVPYRFMPRENDEINECWLCDEGRLEVSRLTEARVLSATLREAGDDEAAECSWSDGVEQAARLLRGVRDERGAKEVGVILSPRQPTEANEAVVRLFGDLLGCQRFAVGGREAGEGDDLLRREDKNPNRRGVLKALGERKVTSLSDLAAAVDNGELKTLFVLGGELPDAEIDVARMSRRATLIVAATNETPATVAADVLLPLAAFAEGPGSFVNCDGVVQGFGQAFPPPGDARTGWSLAGELAAALGFEQDDHEQTEGG